MKDPLIADSRAKYVHFGTLLNGKHVLPDCMRTRICMIHSGVYGSVIVNSTLFQSYQAIQWSPEKHLSTHSHLRP